MLERLHGTFLEPDGSEGTYQIKYYETPEGEIILGYTFSIPTMHKGVAVNPSQVLTAGDLQIFPKSKLRAMEPAEIFEKVRSVPFAKPPRPDLSNESGDEPIDSVLERWRTVPDCWLDLLAQQFGSREAMLQALWVSAPDNGTQQQKLPDKIPYTKEAVTLERGFYASKRMYDGWRLALANTAINYGVPEKVATKIAASFMETNFGDIIYLEGDE